MMSASHRLAQGIWTIGLALVFSLLLGLSAHAQTQTQTPPDYGAWADVSDRAQRMIDGALASNSLLEQMREELVEWRTQFQAAQSINDTRIATLQSQISALGPVPEAGSIEPEEIAEQRAELATSLGEAEAPVRRADAALQLAQGLIAEIDQIISDRQAGELLSLGPSPLNPSNWLGAASAVGKWLQGLGSEIVTYSFAADQLAALRANLPLVLALLVFGGVLVARGSAWVDRFMEGPISHEASSPGARLTVFGLSILRVVIPVGGIVCLIEAVSISGILGLRGGVLIDAIVPFTLTMAGAIWLSRQVFPLRDTAFRPLNLPELETARGRRTSVLLGLMIGLWVVINAISGAENFEDATRLVLVFPIVVITGLLLIRLGRFLLAHMRNSRVENQEPTVVSRMYGVLGRGVIALGLIGPVLAGIGYFTAGSSFLQPMSFSLALLAIIGVLQRLVSDAYGLLTGQNEHLEDALIPTLIGFVLVLISLPFFALIWGVRVAQLSDLWSQFLSGFSAGGITISPTNFIIFATIFGIGYTVTKVVQSTLRNNLLPKTKLDPGGQNALVTGTGYIGVTLAALLAITSAGIDLSSLAIVAGALSVGIGFGLQTIVSNFVSGIILLVERPIKDGDWIEVNGQMGLVREISVRSTRIETFDRSDVIIPNADLISGVVVNMTHQNNAGRVIVPVGVAYGTDSERVAGILQEIAEANPMVLLNPKPSVVFMRFGADSLDFEIRAILRDVNFKLTVLSEMNHAIAKRFAEENIEIPFAQRDIWLRNPEALLAGAKAQTSTMPPKEDGETGDD